MVPHTLLVPRQQIPVGPRQLLLVRLWRVVPRPCRRLLSTSRTSTTTSDASFWQSPCRIRSICAGSSSPQILRTYRTQAKVCGYLLWSALALIDYGSRIALAMHTRISRTHRPPHPPCHRFISRLGRNHIGAGLMQSIVDLRVSILCSDRLYVVWQSSRPHPGALPLWLQLRPAATASQASPKAETATTALGRSAAEFPAQYDTQLGCGSSRNYTALPGQADAPATRLTAAQRRDRVTERSIRSNAEKVARKPVVFPAGSTAAARPAAPLASQ